MSRDDSGFIAEALPAFIAEAREQVGAIEQLLLQLEHAPGDREALDALFRCAHTVKGSAGIFGLDAVVAFTHHVETLLDRLREGRLTLTPALNTLLLACNDQILRLVDAAAGDGSDGSAHAAQRDALVAQLQAAAGECSAAAAPAVQTVTPADAPAGSARWSIDVRFGADTFRNGMDPAAIVAYLAGLGRIASIRCDTAAVPPLQALDAENCHLAFAIELDSDAPRSRIESAFEFVRDDAALAIRGPLAMTTPYSAPAASTMPPPHAPAESTLQPATPPAPAPAAPADAEQRLIRVHADRLDAVINLVGELVIASAGASLLAQGSGQGALVEANAQIARLVEEIRNGALQLRMVPIGETFARFRRVVRDTAAQLGKDVRLEITGGDTELDKSMVERIADPLMHLVRNALDHGLEGAAEREAAGKPAQGRLELAACHESGSILIRIRDDGRGIQRRKVLERAWQRGIVERGVTPSDAAILQLIFEPGFSTAEQVTNLSGRGVGMDVVRRNIESLRGTVVIDSVEGEGSTIEIRLPLTLAIIDGFLVGVGASRFVFPLEAVVEVIENRAARDALDARGRGVIELRGQPLPVVSLRALYDLPGTPPPRGSVVVVRSGTRRWGVVVDQLLGQHQTVIKPLSRLFSHLRGISGSTILGNGEVALILDAASFHDAAALQRHDTRSAA